MPAYPISACDQSKPGNRVLPVRTGPSLEVAIDDLLRGGPAGRRLVDAVAVLLGSGDECVVRLVTGGNGRAAASRLVAACGRLGRSLAGAGADSRRLSLALDAAAVSPLLAWRTRRSLLGPGRVDFVLGPGDFAPAKAERARARRRWIELWRLRTTRARIAFRPEVESACPLLAAEQGDTLLPPVGLQAPADSAWLVYPMDIDRLPAAQGRPREDAIATFIREALDDAATRLDSIRWPSSRQAEDAWLNRRIGISVNGIGSVVRRCGLDPGTSDTFVELDRLLSDIRRLAFEHVRGEPGERPLLPAVRDADPCSRFAPGPLRDAWRDRWQRLVDSAAIAHRNLVVMSPWSLFPEDDPVPEYAALLPLLRHADACAFDRRPRLDAWRLDEFVDFHRRAWALCAQSGARPVVAEQP